MCICIICRIQVCEHDGYVFGMAEGWVAVNAMMNVTGRYRRAGHNCLEEQKSKVCRSAMGRYIVYLNLS